MEGEKAERERSESSMVLLKEQIAAKQKQKEELIGQLDPKKSWKDKG